MGLDLYFVDRKKYEQYEKGKVAYEIGELPTPPKMWEEIVYGRKTWSLVHFFQAQGCFTYDPDGLDDIGNVDLVITKDALMNFFMTLLPYEAYLKALVEKPEENFTELDYQTAEYIYNLISTQVPQLGYEWDCYAFYRMMCAKDELLKVYDDDDNEILMIASY